MILGIECLLIVSFCHILCGAKEVLIVVFFVEENLVVKKVGLFATVFSRYDGTETYYFNSQLFAKFMYVAGHHLFCVTD